MHTTKKNRNTIKVNKVNISYGRSMAVDGVSFTVRSGSVHALIGPNGSGKSSIIHALMGINKPSAGSVEVTGMKLYESSTDLLRIRQSFAVIPDDDDLIESLTGLEYAQLSASLYRVDHELAKKRIEELDALFELGALRDGIASYSHGMRKKLAFIAALVSKRRLYIIDEPTNGLDPDMILLVKDLISSLKTSGCSVLLATHNLDFAQAVADDVTMIRTKRIASGPIDKVLKQAKAKTLEDAYLNLSGGRKKREEIESYMAD